MDAVSPIHGQFGLLPYGVAHVSENDGRPRMTSIWPGRTDFNPFGNPELPDVHPNGIFFYHLWDDFGRRLLHSD
ncbi:unnamed protein product [Pieris brassicae]|uniref:Uncharacterized protein n=1 Tax=Pieris brassicae TaxID=7116 RepID=A0A9P0SQ43_PIEBR|nr:unnamed protein product [Pieris brassicae]